MKIQKELKKVSHKDTFKELAKVYDSEKNFNGRVILRRINEKGNKVEKLCAASFAEFAKIVKSTDHEYDVHKN